MIKSVFFLLIISLLTSCGVKKTEFFVTPKSSKELVEVVNSRIMHYQWSAIQAKAHILTEDQEIIANVSIKTKKDSVIWLSARAFLGIELFRAQLTPDSLYILNKVDKTYFVQPISYFKNVIGTSFSFYDIQDFISNNISIPEEKYNLFLEGDVLDSFELYRGLDGLYSMFSNEAFLLVFWIHFLAISLFLGAWISRDSQRYMVPRFFVIISGIFKLDLIVLTICSLARSCLVPLI